MVIVNFVIWWPKHLNIAYLFVILNIQNQSNFLLETDWMSKYLSKSDFLIWDFYLLLQLITIFRKICAGNFGSKEHITLFAGLVYIQLLLVKKFQILCNEEFSNNTAVILVLPTKKSFGRWYWRGSWNGQWPWRIYSIVNWSPSPCNRRRKEMERSQFCSEHQNFNKKIR